MLSPPLTQLKIKTMSLLMLQVTQIDFLASETGIKYEKLIIRTPMQWKSCAYRWFRPPWKTQQPRSLVLSMLNPLWSQDHIKHRGFFSVSSHHVRLKCMTHPSWDKTSNKKSSIRRCFRQTQYSRSSKLCMLNPKRWHKYNKHHLLIAVSGHH